MTVTFAAAGCSETFDTSLFDLSILSNGTIASSSSNVHNQQRSLLCTANSGSTNRKALAGVAGLVADTGARTSFYFFFDQLPDSSTDADNNKSNDILVVLTIAAGATCFSVGMNSAGNLRIYDNGHVPQATSTTALAINTLYRISFSYTVTDATHNSLKLWINGVLEASATNIAVTVSSNQFYWGINKWDSTTHAANLYYTDIWLDNSSTLDDPGDIRVTAKRPIANGTANDWTTQIGSGGSGVGTGHSPQVNERTLSQTNGWSLVTAGVSKTEEYNIQALSAGDVDITGMRIMGVIGWLFAKATAGNTDSIIVDGTLTNITITTTAKAFRKVSPNPTTYPAGTGTDIGIKSSTTNTHSLYECGISIAYIPGSGPLENKSRLVNNGKLLNGGRLAA